MFAQNLDCGYTLEPPRPVRTLCFGSKIRKKYIPVYPCFAIYILKVGFNWLYITCTCFHDKILTAPQMAPFIYCDALDFWGYRSGPSQNRPKRVNRYENLHMHYTEIFKVVKNENFQQKNN